MVTQLTVVATPTIIASERAKMRGGVSRPLPSSSNIPMSTHRGTAAAAASSTSQSWWSPAAASVPSQEAAGRDYYSLDDILSSHQRVPCRIEQPIYRLGFLNTSSAEAHLLPGSKLELPVWLARRLCSKHVVSVQLPRQYRASQRTILSADAKVVDLHRLGPHYYSVGVQLLSLLEGDEEEASELSRSLLEVKDLYGGVTIAMYTIMML